MKRAMLDAWNLSRCILAPYFIIKKIVRMTRTKTMFRRVNKKSRP